MTPRHERDSNSQL